MVSIKELHEEWFRVQLIRGIPLVFKGKDMIFPVVYMRESDMPDQDVFSTVNNEEIEQTNAASRKLFTLVTRVIANEGYLWEDRLVVEAVGKADKKIKPLEKKLGTVSDENKKKTIEMQIADLRKGLKYPEHPVSIEDDSVVMFLSECFREKKTRPVDFGRLVKSFQEVNLLADEKVEDFLTLPGS